MSRIRSVTNAVIAKLGADPTLLALMPNGVNRPNRGADNATALVQVSFQSGTDVPMFGGRAYEDLRFTVVAVQKIRRYGGVSNVGDAAARIDALLEGQSLTSEDFGTMVLQRTAPIDEDSITDGADPSLIWDVCGGIYQVMVTTPKGGLPPVSVFMQDHWPQEGWTQ